MFAVFCLLFLTWWMLRLKGSRPNSKLELFLKWIIFFALLKISTYPFAIKIHRQVIRWKNPIFFTAFQHPNLSILIETGFLRFSHRTNSRLWCFGSHEEDDYYTRSSSCFLWCLMTSPGCFPWLAPQGKATVANPQKWVHGTVIHQAAQKSYGWDLKMKLPLPRETDRAIKQSVSQGWPVKKTWGKIYQDRKKVNSHYVDQTCS